MLFMHACRGGRHQDPRFDRVATLLVGENFRTQELPPGFWQAGQVILTADSCKIYVIEVWALSKTACHGLSHVFKVHVLLMPQLEVTPYTLPIGKGHGLCLHLWGTRCYGSIGVNIMRLRDTKSRCHWCLHALSHLHAVSSAWLNLLFDCH